MLIGFGASGNLRRLEGEAAPGFAAGPRRQLRRAFRALQAAGGSQALGTRAVGRSGETEVGPTVC